MTRLAPPVLLCGILLAAPGALLGVPAGQCFDWAGFAAKTAGRRIALMLSPAACSVEALVREVRPDAAALKVVWTSDRARCPKQLVTVPREQIRTVKLKGNRGTCIGLAVLGAVGGYAAAVAATFPAGDEFGVGAGEVALFGGAAVGGATAGYYLGQRLSPDITLTIQ